MKHRLALAAACAAAALGFAASAEAAPVSGHLAAKPASDVIAVHYDYYRQRPWWWYSQRYDHHDPYWKRRFWRKHRHERDWSWRDDDRRDYDRYDRRRR